MNIRMIIVLAPLALFAGTAAQAQTNPEAAAPQKPVVKEKRLCRTDDDTGSIVPKRTCHTKAEWSAIDAQSENTSELEAPRRNQRP